MKYFYVLLTILIVTTISCSHDDSHGLAFKNGNIFNGQTFDNKTFYVIDGTISFKAPGTIDSLINLQNKYVIPPYGEAHNHNMDDYKTDEKIENYLSKGIYYIKVPNILPRSRKSIEDKINIPTSVDVVFSNGGLTASNGHPLGLVKRNISRGVFKPEDAEGQFYHIIDDTISLNSKWEHILSQKPDFIKTYLLYSEEFETRKNDTAFFAWKGLSPKALNAIVSKAHKSGLRVSTHIETSGDFKHAVTAGVDEINHFPGFRPEKAYLDRLSVYAIEEKDAKMAGEKNITVITTLGYSIDDILSNPSDSNSLIMDVMENNIKLLKKYNVPIAIGSDNYGGTSYDEISSLSKSKLFNNLELLKMWTEATVATIFPDKKLGLIQSGYIANFLVLEENPLYNFKNFQKISMLVKEGKIIKTTSNNK
jgi:imidazolonepropionase-like amidohydrolase